MAIYEHKRTGQQVTVSGDEAEAAYAANAAFRPVTGPPPLTHKQQLQAKAEALGLPTAGTVAELEARIAEHEAKLADLQKQAASFGLDTEGSLADLQAQVDAKLAE